MRPEIKLAAAESDTESTTEQESAGGSGQDDPGEDDDDLTQTNTSDSYNANDRSAEQSPSCGWRGVARAMHVWPGR
jgi:hypothetical protein